MKNGRIACGLILLIISALFLVPLKFELAISVSESPMTLDRFVRMSQVNTAIGYFSLFFQAASGWLLNSGLPIRQSLPLRMLQFLGLIAASILLASVFGLLVLQVSGGFWHQIVRRFI